MACPSQSLLLHWDRQRKVLVTNPPLVPPQGSCCEIWGLKVSVPLSVKNLAQQVRRRDQEPCKWPSWVMVSLAGEVKAGSL